tara:strand:- start:27 stop:242 length:216 start_codon:yes stop_codon:yes gene_type:complete
MNEEVKKFYTALFNLKSGVECTTPQIVKTEEDYNKILWNTGVDSKGNAITTTTCPHSEITWTKVKEEMDKL